jgi:hypothetical protein
MESEDTPVTDTQSAQRALDDARRIKAEFADKAACPPGWHFVFGALMGSVVAAQAANPPYTLYLEGGVVVAVALLLVFWKRRMGYFINGYRAGRTRRVTATLLAVFLVVYGVSVYLKAARGLAWAPLAGAVIVFVAATWASVVWQRVYRAELLGAGTPK